VNIPDPDDFTYKEPDIKEEPDIFVPPWSTIKPFFTLNSLGIL
jgi:hypothetical protein